MHNLLFFPLPLESFQNIYKLSKEWRKKENKVALFIWLPHPLLSHMGEM